MLSNGARDVVDLTEIEDEDDLKERIDGADPHRTGIQKGGILNRQGNIESVPNLPERANDSVVVTPRRNVHAAKDRLAEAAQANPGAEDRILQEAEQGARREAKNQVSTHILETARKDSKTTDPAKRARGCEMDSPVPSRNAIERDSSENSEQFPKRRRLDDENSAVDLLRQFGDGVIEPLAEFVERKVELAPLYRSLLNKGSFNDHTLETIDRADNPDDFDKWAHEACQLLCKSIKDEPGITEKEMKKVRLLYVGFFSALAYANYMRVRRDSLLLRLSHSTSYHIPTKTTALMLDTNFWNRPSWFMAECWLLTIESNLLVDLYKKRRVTFAWILQNRSTFSRTLCGIFKHVNGRTQEQPNALITILRAARTSLPIEQQVDSCLSSMIRIIGLLTLFSSISSTHPMENSEYLPAFKVEERLELLSTLWNDEDNKELMKGLYLFAITSVSKPLSESAQRRIRYVPEEPWFVNQLSNCELIFALQFSPLFLNEKQSEEAIKNLLALYDTSEWVEGGAASKCFGYIQQFDSEFGIPEDFRKTLRKRLPEAPSPARQAIPEKSALKPQAPCAEENPMSRDSSSGKSFGEQRNTEIQVAKSRLAELRKEFVHLCKPIPKRKPEWSD